MSTDFIDVFGARGGGHFATKPEQLVRIRKDFHACSRVHNVDKLNVSFLANWKNSPKTLAFHFATAIVKVISRANHKGENTMYAIIDTKTGLQVGNLYSEAKLARRQRDRLDVKYGAVRYIVRPV